MAPHFSLYAETVHLTNLVVAKSQMHQLAERNSTKIGHMVARNCNLKTHVQNLGCSFPLQIGGPKTTFLDDFATAYIFGMKHDIDNRSIALTTTKDHLHRPHMS